jgi:hypothetical protein
MGCKVWSMAWADIKGFLKIRVSKWPAGCFREEADTNLMVGINLIAVSPARLTMMSARPAVP